MAVNCRYGQMLDRELTFDKDERRFVPSQIIAAKRDRTLCTPDSTNLCSDGRIVRCCANGCAPFANIGLNESCAEHG